MKKDWFTFKGKKYEIIEDNSRKEGFQIIGANFETKKVIIFAGFEETKEFPDKRYTGENLYGEWDLKTNDKDQVVFDDAITNVYNITWQTFCD